MKGSPPNGRLSCPVARVGVRCGRATACGGDGPRARPGRRQTGGRHPCRIAASPRLRLAPDHREGHGLARRHMGRQPVVPRGPRLERKGGRGQRAPAQTRAGLYREPPPQRVADQTGELSRGSAMDVFFRHRLRADMVPVSRAKPVFPGTSETGYRSRHEGGAVAVGLR